MNLRSRAKHPDIADIARRTGVPASTLRFYEEKGLIASIGRRGLRRLFGPDIFERLALIALGRAAGFSLHEIADMLMPDGSPRIDRDKLLAKAEDLDRTIQRLTAMREGLRHAAACTALHPMECPTFQRVVRLAGAGAFEPPKPMFKAEEVAPSGPATASRRASAARRR